MPSPVKPKTIDKQFGPGGQSVYFVEVVALGPERLRIEIRSDSYMEQSYARVSLFSGGKWQLVHSILPSLMKTPHGLSNQPRGKGATEQNFSQDRAQLLRVASAVLFTN